MLYKRRYKKSVIEEYTDMTQKEIAKEIGVSHQSISRTEKEAIKKLKKAIYRFPYLKEFVDEIKNDL